MRGIRRWLRRAPLGALLLPALALPACLGPPLPREERKPEIVLRTEADDQRAGAEISKEVGGEMGILDHPELAAYVSEIGRRLVRHAPRRRFDYRFQIVDQDVPNAFALPGGYVYVSRGLLILANSEDELANVIAHEIIHVAARHPAARQSVIRGVPVPLQFFAMAHVASYSREQEREADRLGQGLAGVAGFDPEGMAAFLRHLEFGERLRLGASRLPGFLDTHPTTSERVATASARARVVAWRRVSGAAPARSDFLRRLEGLVVGTAASEGVFREERFVHPELDFTLRFPPGWETRNTRRAVGAISPRHDALVFLEHQKQGDDPRQAAVEYLAEAAQRGLAVKREVPVKLGRLPAWRIEGSARHPLGSLQVTLTWIAHRESIYRLTGVAVGRDSNRLRGTFRNVARSFRPLPRGLRTGIREQRLRIVAARAGESLKSLSERTGNEWDIQRTAVVNDVFASDPLPAGRLMKVAVSQSYRASAPTPSSAASAAGTAE